MDLPNPITGIPLIGKKTVPQRISGIKLFCNLIDEN
jgi:hypothetical protein